MPVPVPVDVNGNIIEDAPLAKFLFNDTRSAWLWLSLRIWLASAWLDSAAHKIGNPAWTETGAALQGFWTSIVQIPAEGRPPITYDWYRTFIQFLLDSEAYTWFGPLVAYGERIVGILLLLGVFTGLAAFAGAFMNWNFMLAGSASTNPMLFVVAVGLLLAWKVSGYFGLDYYLLPRLGTPWLRKKNAASEKKASA